MIKFHCQPSWMADRLNTWEVDADDPRKAAERFQSVYDSERGAKNPPNNVRVIHPDGREQLFSVRSVEIKEYTAEEIKT